MTSDFYWGQKIHDKDDDLSFEEEDSLLDKNMTMLVNNHHHLLSYSDKSNYQQQAIKRLNFGSLVKETPFQKDSASTSTEDTSDTNSREKEFNNLALTSSKHRQIRSSGIGVIMNKSYSQDNTQTIMCNYSPRHKTYPHGILKSQKVSKFHHKSYSKSPEKYKYNYLERDQANDFTDNSEIYNKD